jgi:hypothetical protein
MTNEQKLLSVIHVTANYPAQGSAIINSNKIWYTPKPKYLKKLKKHQTKPSHLLMNVL